LRLLGEELARALAHTSGKIVALGNIKTKEQFELFDYFMGYLRKCCWSEIATVPTLTEEEDGILSTVPRYDGRRRRSSSRLTRRRGKAGRKRKKK
jgi:hypothetical protein